VQIAFQFATIGQDMTVPTKSGMGISISISHLLELFKQVWVNSIQKCGI